MTCTFAFAGVAGFAIGVILTLAGCAWWAWNAMGEGK